MAASARPNFLLTLLQPPRNFVKNRSRTTVLWIIGPTSQDGLQLQTVFLPNNVKMPQVRCTTDSKAAGRSEEPAALPSSPIRCRVSLHDVG
jgi:hypothetical protein